MPWQPAWQGDLYARELPELPPSAYWWRKAAQDVQRMTVAGDKSLLEWVMAHCTGQGWQLQIAQTGERSSVLAWQQGELMLGFGKADAPGTGAGVY
jgi:assimilatory nitrate reductase catalytic subunit